jgi:hypothetical protein
MRERFNSVQQLVLFFIMISSEDCELLFDSARYMPSNRGAANHQVLKKILSGRVESVLYFI